MTDYNEMKALTFDDRDEFSRKPIAEKIIKLLNSDINVSPLIIDGKWGTGKTEFCFKLKNLIESDNPNEYKIGYVNAFQADHANEPLLTLIAEVAGFYGEDNDKRQNFIASAIPYLRLVTGLGVKAALGFAFGRYATDIPDELADSIDEIREGSKSLIDQSIESLIKDQVEAEKNLATLRDALTDIASSNPIILLIDELDRCRPDFAVMMLETIKHVFDVENVQIILITNAEQLKATIKHSYGSETNSHDYLYKFFKYQINLPTTIKDVEGISIENNVTHFRTTVEKSKVIPQEFKDNNFIYDIPTFINVSKLSLRNIEQIVRCIETLIIFEDEAQSQSPVVEQILMVFISFIYILNKDLLIQVSDKTVNSEIFFKFVGSQRLYLPRDVSVVRENYVRSLILVLFNTVNENNNIHIPRDDYSDSNQGNEILRNMLSKIDLEKEAERYSGYISESSYLHAYIDHTVNNLLLFDIVK
ncbi:P-loop NTPase fold protein [Psychrobacter sp. GP33]|uniref:KAP family P-loop NTPase fold protein n=1 Tax=Psychrobacter sp. GP33 TaxID=2758709 RepID=UPI0015F862DF|nr:P-loop NTPase fold protein [Psychrobacter sp. GP33]